jgi:hypothetical protein
MNDKPNEPRTEFRHRLLAVEPLSPDCRKRL